MSDEKETATLGELTERLNGLADKSIGCGERVNAYYQALQSGAAKLVLPTKTFDDMAERVLDYRRDVRKLNEAVHELHEILFEFEQVVLEAANIAQKEEHPNA